MNYSALKVYIEENYPDKIKELVEYLDSDLFVEDVNNVMDSQSKVNEYLNEYFAATCVLDSRADEDNSL